MRGINKFNIFISVTGFVILPISDLLFYTEMKDVVIFIQVVISDYPSDPWLKKINDLNAMLMLNSRLTIQ